jgi:hypothetical protein
VRRLLAALLALVALAAAAAPAAHAARGLQRAAPSPFTFTAAERDYDAYGWRVRLRRARMAFSTLADAGPRGFRLRNAGGRARVTTAPLYRPRSAHSVAVGRAAPRTIPADRRGRLRIDLRGDATVRIGARAGSLAA